MSIKFQIDILDRTKSKKPSGAKIEFLKIISVILVSTLSLLIPHSTGAGSSKHSRSHSEDRFLAALSRDPDLKVRQEMAKISRQLGVTCTYCHDPSNLKDGKMKNYQTAKIHMSLVREVNANFRLGTPVDCYMCHRGQAKPDVKEKLSLGE